MQDAKGASELGEIWGRGFRVGRLAFNGLHFVNGLLTHSARGSGRLEDSFQDSKKTEGWYRLKEQTGKEARGDQEGVEGEI